MGSVLLVILIFVAGGVGGLLGGWLVNRTEWSARYLARKRRQWLQENSDG